MSKCRILDVIEYFIFGEIRLMAGIFEEWHNASLLYFIKENKKVTIEQIKEEFPVNEEVVNLNNLVEDDLKQLLGMGKIKFEEGYYSVIEH
ncbi:hypothetical protein [Clostridium botulinum]|uniref:hypothetical protein n=1 Tax=Clostridium botulinum TaxID=1491 RepID=UPI001F60138E|nr:hypothetical protein [Clostridium botulinum]